MPPFLDTNILVYTRSEGVKANIAADILEEPWQTSIQALNEFALASRRKLKLEWHEIGEAIADFMQLRPKLQPITLETHLIALRVAERYRLRFYDSVTIAAALLAGADTLLSEDMHAGLVVDNRLTIVNPFA